jgi:hypothetical protein
LSQGYSQEKSKKELKEEQKLESQRLIEEMINSKDFVFIAKTALPSGMRSIDLTTNPNYVKFKPDLIDGYLPYFGKANNAAAAMTGDVGLKFKNKPEEFNVSKKKNNYTIEANVGSEKDFFRLSLSVGLEGNATLAVTSNNRSFISYQGNIFPPEAAK